MLVGGKAEVVAAIEPLLAPSAKRSGSSARIRLGRTRPSSRQHDDRHGDRGDGRRRRPDRKRRSRPCGFFELILGTLFAGRAYESYSAQITEGAFEPGFKAKLAPQGHAAGDRGWQRDGAQLADARAVRRRARRSGSSRVGREGLVDHGRYDGARRRQLAAARKQIGETSMKTWLITGCSKGFGKRLALAAASGAIRSSRRPGMSRRWRKWPRLSRPHDRTAARRDGCGVRQGRRRKGGGDIRRLDILVNNAGYGLFGAIEEGTPEEYRPMFEVNVFGLIETTRAAPARPAKNGWYDRQPVVRRGHRRVRRRRILQRREVRGRRIVRSAVGRAEAVRHPGGDRRTRPVPHRIPGAVDHHGGEGDARICCKLAPPLS